MIRLPRLPAQPARRGGRRLSEWLREGGSFLQVFVLTDGREFSKLGLAKTITLVKQEGLQSMKSLTQFKTTTRPVRKPISPVGAGFLVLLLLACFGLAPMAQAVGPDTDGSIPGSNDGEGIGVLVSRATGVWNTGTGFEALNHLTSGNQNTATGLRALNSDINGGFNTATGVLSLFSNTSGFFNSATGAYSLANNISGTRNTANGYAALYRNTADDNTATGFAALYHNNIGIENTASGATALQSNTTGSDNMANGHAALAFNTEGGFNTAIGASALLFNITGSNNVAVGFAALSSNSTWGSDTDSSVAVGYQALLNSDSPSTDNNAVGHQALQDNTTGGFNNAFGWHALNQNTSGFLNTAIGDGAGSEQTDGSSNVYIGAGMSGIAGENNACYIASIFNQTSPSGVAVLINSNNKLGTMTSSKRFKEQIKPMDKASEALFSLKPVTFRYKKEIDPVGTSQFGLVAEDVEKVNPDLMVRDKEGKPYSVRYDQVNAMLLNEFLKEHRKVEEQEATIAGLKSTVAQQRKDFEVTAAQLSATLNEQAAQIQKVSAQLELNKPAPRTVANDQ